VAVDDLADRFGTPLFVYSRTEMLERLAAVRAAFGDDALICYAVKANPNLAILRELGAAGAGFDVVSGGELARLDAAGVGDRPITFAGAAKSTAEISAALSHPVTLINLESEHELEPLIAGARAHGRRAPLAVRINPDLPVATHRHTRTGGKDDKFGLDFEAAQRVVSAIDRAADALDLRGFHVHLGSQVREIEPYLAAFDSVMAFSDSLGPLAASVDHYDLGGGFAIGYGHAAGRFDVAALGAALAPRIRARGLRPVLEPGRFLVGDAGILVTSVLGLKERPTHRFALVDAAMTELIRPALYSAVHPILPTAGLARPTAGVADVVGPVCESGDFLGKARDLPQLRVGERLAVLAAGAYGSSMASNYNTRPRAAEVMVSGTDVRLIRRRQSVSDLWSEELLP
jgi:diaminopimelate decarboxylase